MHYIQNGNSFSINLYVNSHDSARTWLETKNCCVVCRTPSQMLVRCFGFPVEGDAPALDTDSSKRIAEYQVKAKSLELENEQLHLESLKHSGAVGRLENQVKSTEEENQKLLHRNSQLATKVQSLERKCTVYARLVEKTKAEVDRLKQEIHSMTVKGRPDATLKKPSVSSLLIRKEAKQQSTLPPEKQLDVPKTPTLDTNENKRIASDSVDFSPDPLLLSRVSRRAPSETLKRLL